MRTHDRSRSEFERFFATHKDACFRALCATVSPLDEADDLTSEGFARAWERWPEVRRHPSPAAWVVRTALNLHRDRWRREGNPRRHLFLVPDEHHDRESLVDPALLAALRALPEQQRAVIVHRVLLDLSTEQTAIELGIAAGTVGTHLKRALAALRTHLDDQSTATEAAS